MPSRSRPTAPRRVLTDWTTSAGVDGTGLLALVLGGATAEAIHLANDSKYGLAAGVCR